MVIFDFDGVIANSWEAVMGIVRLADPEISEEEYRERFHGNVGGTVADLTDQLGYDFFDEYAARSDEVPLFTGMREVIETLADRYVLTIVSSTRTDILEAFLRVHDLRSHFAGLYGSTEGFSKTKKLQRVLNEQEMDVEQAVFVTDTLGDVREASGVRVPTIVVTWGYHGERTLQAGAPAMVVRDPSKLVEAIATILE